MSALYLGAGFNLNPPLSLSNIKIFYYVDKNPNLNDKYILKDISLTVYGKELNDHMRVNGFHKVYNDYNYTMYINNMRDQVIHYFFNIDVEKKFYEIEDRVKDYKYLIIGKYHPNNFTINKNDINLIGLENVDYIRDYINGPNFNDNIIHKIIKSYIERKKISNYLFLKNNGVVINFSTFNHFIKYIECGIKERFNVDYENTYNRIIYYDLKDTVYVDMDDRMGYEYGYNDVNRDETNDEINVYEFINMDLTAERNG